MTEPIRYVEIDIKACSLTYGSSPCTASVGVTGTKKCYNSPRTCQDVANYDETEKTIRFSVPKGGAAKEIEALPCIASINRRPMKLDPGESLGVRESVTVSFNNFKHNDDGFDNYLSDRSFNAYNQGTFWGKFTARWGNLQGCEFRTIDGYIGQSLGSMETRHYIVDSFKGPDSKGMVSITAKDILTLLDGDKAQYPAPGTLEVSTLLTDTGTSLSTVGSDLRYNLYEYGSIGDEMVQYTYFGGNTFNLVGRGLFGSEQAEHEIEETFQYCPYWNAEKPSEIIYDILYWGVPSLRFTSWIDKDQWEEECDAYLNRLYTAMISKPTSVKQLINDLMVDAGLTLWPDVKNKVLRLQVLRQDTPSATIDGDLIVEDSVSSKKLSQKRVSQTYVYYARKNPLEGMSEKKNYKSIFTRVTTDPVVALEDSPPAIREIMSRYIPLLNQDAADNLSERIISRYENDPREVAFMCRDFTPVQYGQQVTFKSRVFENDEGEDNDPLNLYITQIDTANGYHKVIGEEVALTIQDPGSVRNITVSTNIYNMNLRDAHDLQFTTPTSGDTVNLIISAGAIIGSTNLSHALVIGDWPSGVTINIKGSGRIQGKGGDATYGDGGDGGPALYTRYPVDILTDIEVWGGGGAGGAEIIFGNNVGGGGGAGSLPGSTTAGGGLAATTESGAGTAGSGGPGAGGDPGLAGENRTSFNGGAAGNAVDGASFVTNTGSPDYRGSQIN